MLNIHKIFKPHIVQFSDGKYGIRKLDILGWTFADRHSISQWGFWSTKYQQHWLRTDLESAKALLNDYFKAQNIDTGKFYE